jgi:hypothetical protein
MLFCPETTSEKGNAMNDFISRYSDQISGVITGFDRLVFRGNLALNHETGMKAICGPTALHGRITPNMSGKSVSG